MPKTLANELVELNLSDARLRSKIAARIARINAHTAALAEDHAALVANGKRRCELMQQAGRRMVEAKLMTDAEIEPMVVRPKED